MGWWQKEEEAKKAQVETTYIVQAFRSYWLQEEFKFNTLSDAKRKAAQVETRNTKTSLETWRADILEYKFSKVITPTKKKEKDIPKELHEFYDFIKTAKENMNTDEETRISRFSIHLVNAIIGEGGIYGNGGTLGRDGGSYKADLPNALGNGVMKLAKFIYKNPKTLSVFLIHWKEHSLPTMEELLKEIKGDE